MFGVTGAVEVLFARADGRLMRNQTIALPGLATAPSFSTAATPPPPPTPPAATSPSATATNGTVGEDEAGVRAIPAASDADAVIGGDDGVVGLPIAVPDSEDDEDSETEASELEEDSPSKASVSHTDSAHLAAVVEDSDATDDDSRSDAHGESGDGIELSARASMADVIPAPVPVPSLQGNTLFQLLAPEPGLVSESMIAPAAVDGIAEVSPLNTQPVKFTQHEI